MARVQLKKFIRGPLNPEKRRQVAAYYTKLLNNRLPEIRTPIEKEWAYHTFLRYIIRVKENRNNLFKHLKRKNITTFIHYAAPLHTYQVFTNRWGSQIGRFPVTEKLAQEVLTLPSGGTLTRKQLDYVINSVAEFSK
jgi:dTDP-4-amino-4,6-dideoxygalactose transaminase